MPDISLPLEVTAAQIAFGISVVQTRCRAHLADPARLAHLVRRQLDRAEAMAHAVDVPLSALQPSMQAWEGGQFVQTTTVVDVQSSGLRIHRGQPWGTAASGSLHLYLKQEGGA